MAKLFGTARMAGVLTDCVHKTGNKTIKIRFHRYWLGGAVASAAWFWLLMRVLGVFHPKLSENNQTMM